MISMRIRQPMTHYSLLFPIDTSWKLFVDQIDEFVCDITEHIVMVFPRLLNGVDVKAGTGTEIVRIVCAGNVDISRRRVRANYHDLVFSGVSERIILLLFVHVRSYCNL